MDFKLLIVVVSIGVIVGKAEDNFQPVPKTLEDELKESRLLAWLRNKLAGKSRQDVWTPMPKENVRRNTQTYKHFVCEGALNYIAHCPWSTYMNVLEGKWGRENQEICGTSHTFVNWCSHIVVRKLKATCDGLFVCSLNVTNQFFDNIDPCGGSSKYLNFTYECIPDNERCQQNEFKCINSKKCIPLSQTCDGSANSCGANDNSDEIYCDEIESKTTTTPTTTTTTPTTTTTTPTTTTTTPTTTTTTPTTTTTTPTTTTTTSTTTTTKATTTKAPLGTCGISYFPPDLSPVVTRIINGTEARQNSWPWQIQLRLKDKHHCGAAVVDTHWVITASHCFVQDDDLSHYTIIAGKHSKDVADTYQQVRNISKKISHKTGIHILDGDISMIKLDRPLEYSEYVVPICLPSHATKTDDICCATGWGNTLGTGFKDKLKQVQLPVVDRESCNAAMNGWVTNNMICTWDKTGNTDTCSGDSGGPLVCNVDNKWELHGLVSFGGPECATKEFPGVYTNVYRYKDWIENIKKDRSS